MKIGTKSVLWGAHCFFVHPFFVAFAWWKLYGFRRVEIGRFTGLDHRARRYVHDRPVLTSLLDPRLWVAFFVHDIGYIGKPNMDGIEGEMHPLLGARIMHFLFDWGPCVGDGICWECHDWRWFKFAFYHSRFLAKRDGRTPSRLCAADKLAVALEPWWLYLPRVIATGEIHEYMGLRRHGKYAAESRGQAAPTSRREWHRRMSLYCYEWAYEHADGRADTWTPATGEWGA